VQRLFEQTKKIMVVALTAHFTTPKGNARTFVNLQEKKMSNFTAPVAQAERSTLRIRIFLPEVFFLLLKEKKRITVIFFIISFF
jgi:hypothetical protein